MTADSCSCDECSSACRFKPGWFLPGEAELAAKFMGLTLEQFFEKYLLIDWYEEDMFVLSPGITKLASQGTKFPEDPHGQCIFFDQYNSSCSIHPVKPYECREYFHTDEKRRVNARHRYVARKWHTLNNQKQLSRLLLRKPELLKPKESSAIHDHEEVELWHKDQRKPNYHLSRYGQNRTKIVSYEERQQAFLEHIHGSGLYARHDSGDPRATKECRWLAKWVYGLYEETEEKE